MRKRGTYQADFVNSFAQFVKENGYDKGMNHSYGGQELAAHLATKLSRMTTNVCNLERTTKIE